jgi:hypothetical protein
MVPAMEPPPGLAINSKNAIMIGVVPQAATLGVTLVVLGVTIQEAIVEMEIPWWTETSMTCPPWAVILVAAAAAMLAMGPLLGAAVSADGVVLILKISQLQLSIKVGATIQVRRTTTPGTWSHPICKEEMGVDVVVALVEVWMMVVPLNGEDPNPNIQAQPLQDPQVCPFCFNF